MPSCCVRVAHVLRHTSEHPHLQPQQPGLLCVADTATVIFFQRLSLYTIIKSSPSLYTVIKSSPSLYALIKSSPKWVINHVGLNALLYVLARTRLSFAGDAQIGILRADVDDPDGAAQRGRA